MSGFVNSLAAAAASLTSWRNNLRPASFRGVPFFVDDAGGTGGRRKVSHEFPLRDVPYIEDLGQAANKYRVRAWVVGDDYLQQSRDLISACQDYDTPAIFVNPWRGEILCSAGALTWHESKDKGGFCAIDIEFHVESGGLPSPTAQIDTVSSLLAGVGSLLKLAVSAYEDVSLLVEYPQLLLPLMGGLVGGALGAAAGNLIAGLLSLPSATMDGQTQAAAAIAGSVGDDSAMAAGIQAVFQAAAQNAIIAATPVSQADDPVLGISPLLAPASDPSGGLAALATWGSALPVPANPILAAQQGAFQALVQGQAVLAVLTVYASIDWPSSQAATAARTQVQTMIDAQLDLAAAQGQDALYLGWQAIGSAAMLDLITRAQALPSLVSFIKLSAQPSLVLAWGWYQDAARCDELDLLNDVPDPMFMPLTGVRLSA